MRIYVDGEMAAEAPAPFVAQTLGETFKLGDDGWHIPHKGARTLLDEVRIYAYPLSPERIDELAGRWRLTVVRAAEEGRWTASLQLGTRVAAGVRVQVTPAGGGEALVRADATVGDEAALAELDVSDLPPGDYSVSAQVLDADGAVVGDTTVPMRRLRRQMLALDNGRLRVVFDAGTGAISRIEAPAQGWSAAAPIAPPPLLTLTPITDTPSLPFLRRLPSGRGYGRARRLFLFDLLGQQTHIVDTGGTNGVHHLDNTPIQ